MPIGSSRQLSSKAILRPQELSSRAILCIRARACRRMRAHTPAGIARGAGQGRAYEPSHLPMRQRMAEEVEEDANLAME